MQNTPSTPAPFAPTVAAYPAVSLTNGRQNFDDADRSGAMWFVNSGLTGASVVVTVTEA